jgi:hypothetical protein
MLKAEVNWNLVPFPTSSTKGGWKGRAQSSGIRLGRGTLLIYSVLHPKPTMSWLKLILHPFGVGTNHGQPWTHLTHHGLGLGEAITFPPYSILCVAPPCPRPNGSLSRDSQSGVPKLSRFGLPGLWAFITSRSDLRLGQGLKRTCNSPTVCRTPSARTGIGLIPDFLWSRVKLSVWLPTLLSTITCAADVQMAHARPFRTSTLQDLSNGIKNISMQGILTPAIVF